MAIRNELIEELLAEKDPQEVFAQDGLLDELKKALAERILNAEMDQHLAAERTRRRPGSAEPPQRPQPQDGADRDRRLGAAGAARPAGELRAAADRQVPAAASRISTTRWSRSTPGA